MYVNRLALHSVIKTSIENRNSTMQD